ncbi:sulfotransferase [Vibrio wakamikoensis]|uniref:Sulfotransferase n=1 Tax=Vibrio chaetopteri TaxID=3016528 RepID=A0AAU8BJ21_9VIBR
MLNYYLQETQAAGVGVHFFSPTIGQVANAKVEFKGKLSSSNRVKGIRVECLSEQHSIGVVWSAAPDLSDEGTAHTYRFSLEVDSKQITEEHDLHFCVLVEYSDTCDEVACGFIQKVHPVDSVVFVVGSPRSGTSALGKGLRKGLEANAHGESHVIEGFQRILETIDAFFVRSKTAQIKNNLVNVLPYTVLLAEQVRSLRRVYELYYGNQVILDKTPGIPMLKALPIALIAWPNAKVVFCKRRALENVKSREIKFPAVSFEAHLAQWKQSFIAWRQTKQQINQALKTKDWAMEVDQKQMSDHSNQVALQVSTFLNLSKRGHNKLERSLTNDRPEQTSAPTKQARNLSQFGWSETQQQALVKVCGDELKRQGYSLDERYYL